MLTSNYQPSEKFLEQKIKNSSRKNSTRQSAFHEWWLICHEWWRPIFQVTVSFMISVTTVPWSWKRAISNFFLGAQTCHEWWQICHEWWHAGWALFSWYLNGSICIKYTSNSSLSLRGYKYYSEISWRQSMKLSKHI